MLLSECVLVPYGTLPLHIFEPRYRQLLDYALAKDRMMCIGTLTGDDEGDEDIFEFSTAAVIRASVGHENGTSHLVLQGVERVHFLGWEQRLPFRIAKVAPVKPGAPPGTPDASLVENLFSALEATCIHAQDKEVIHRLRGIEDPAILSDMMGAYFLKTTELRLPLLGMADPEMRLRYLRDVIEVAV
jgi:Lon protease-like protein